MYEIEVLWDCVLYRIWFFVEIFLIIRVIVLMIFVFIENESYCFCFDELYWWSGIGVFDFVVFMVRFDWVILSVWVKNKFFKILSFFERILIFCFNILFFVFNLLICSIVFLVFCFERFLFFLIVMLFFFFFLRYLFVFFFIIFERFDGLLYDFLFEFL